MHLTLKTLPLFMMLASSAALSQTAPPAATPRQDPAMVRTVVEDFLQTQAAALPGRVEIKVGQLDARMNMPACAALEAFLPGGARVWGKTTVGVRCAAPSPWTLYVASSVQVWADYLAAAAPLAQGQSLGQGDVTKMNGDLTTLPPGIITDASQAVGRTVAISIPAGTPLRRDSLKTQQAVQQGQMVRLVSSGAGFKVSSEARSMTNAAEGQVAQARTPAGLVVSGIARLGGIVEVAY